MSTKVHLSPANKLPRSFKPTSIVFPVRRLSKVMPMLYIWILDCVPSLLAMVFRTYVYDAFYLGRTYSCLHIGALLKQSNNLNHHLIEVILKGISNVQLGAPLQNAFK